MKGRTGTSPSRSWPALLAGPSAHAASITDRTSEGQAPHRPTRAWPSRIGARTESCKMPRCSETHPVSVPTTSVSITEPIRHVRHRMAAAERARHSGRRTARRAFATRDVGAVLQTYR